MVTCSVCETRIDNASENGGSFRVEKGDTKITDTCEDCAGKLAAAVSSAALEIRALTFRRLRGEAPASADPRIMRDAPPHRAPWPPAPKPKPFLFTTGLDFTQGRAHERFARSSVLHWLYELISNETQCNQDRTAAAEAFLAATKPDGPQ